MSKFSIAARVQKPSKALITVGNKTLTYGEQWSRMRALQKWLNQQEVSGERPLLLAVGDELEQASLLLALIVLGKPPLIFDPCSTPVEAAHIMAISDLSAAISDKKRRERWNLGALKLPQLPVAEAMPEKGVLGSLLRKRSPAADDTSWPRLVEALPEPFEVDVEPDSLAYVVFTSGTTSIPKGVEITRESLISQLTTLREQYGLDGDSRILNTLPLHHVDGLLQGPLLAWISGCSVHRPLPFSTQGLQRYMDSIYRDRITHFIAVPTILSLMNRFGQEWRDCFDGESFRMIVSCAAHLDRHLWEQLESAFGVAVVNMYGLSETGTSALFSGPDTETRRVGTIGKPVNSRIRITDDEGNDVMQGVPGELLIAGPQLMRGYHKNPEATAQSIRGGWLHTGDLARELESGHIEIVGRIKNLIVSGGRNISPEEIADCLNQHPAVIESIAFGQPDADWGERVVAVAVADPGAINEAALVEWCRSRLSEYKVPKHILVAGQLEKGPAGKIRIEAARRLYESRLLERSRQPDAAADVETRVLQLAADTFQLPLGELNRDSTIENTPGWDSLGHLSLLLAAESEFGLRFSAREIMQIDSIDRLIQLCSGRPPA